VLSISYRRDAIRSGTRREGPNKWPAWVAVLLGAFRGGRHWVSLRTENTNGQFVVLHLGNDEQAKRAIVALEERTGRSAELVAQRRMTSK
jgi:hypothetical protein